jgi:hypothetical protein
MLFLTVTANSTKQESPSTVNDAPDAADDAFLTDKNIPITVAVLDNDTDVDGDALTATPLGAPAHGTVSGGGPDPIVYTPALDYIGPDSFTYQVSDGHGGTDTATVFITVRPEDRPPVAVDDTIDTATTPNSFGVFFLPLTNDSDPDGDGLFISHLGNPSHGQAGNLGNTVGYLPNPGFTGTDSFSYEISDGRGGHATATIFVNVGGQTQRLQRSAHRRARYRPERRLADAQSRRIVRLHPARRLPRDGLVHLH